MKLILKVLVYLTHRQALKVRHKLNREQVNLILQDLL